MPEIRSESKFIWKFIVLILLTPITLIQVIFGRKKGKSLLDPFREAWKFIIEPKFTFSIILINAAIFFTTLVMPSLINQFGIQPSNLFSLKFYTVVTSGFLHADLTHLIGNTVALFIFGRIVERQIGGKKTALVYFGAMIISGIFFSLIHLFILGDNPLGVGASGAIMGLVSAAILLDPLYIIYELILPMPVMIAGWLAIYADIVGIINPVEDGIGHFAHLGGFLSIGVLLFLFGRFDRKKIKKGFIINLISLLVFASLLYFNLIPKI